MEFSRQEYWSWLPFPPPGDRPDPGNEPMSPASPALAGGFFTTEPPGKPNSDIMACYMGSSGFGSIPRWGIFSSSSPASSTFLVYSGCSVGFPAFKKYLFIFLVVTGLSTAHGIFSCGM